MTLSEEVCANVLKYDCFYHFYKSPTVALQDLAVSEEVGPLGGELAECQDWLGEEAAALELFGEDALTM